MAGREYGGREAAFANIFGQAPPPGRAGVTPGRTQTMGADPYQRSQTMTSQYERAPPIRNHSNYHQGPPGGPAPPPQNPYNHPPGGQHRTFSASQQLPPQRQYQSQPLQQPFNPQQPPQQQRYYPQHGQGGPPSRIPPHYQPPRSGQPGPGPALASDPFRSQSLATPRPQMQQPGPGSYNNISPAHTFRQQQYHPSRTPQGRVVPERPDERTMSMSSYSRDHHHTQTMSGRIIPDRQRMSNDTVSTTDRTSHGSIPQSEHSPQTKGRTTSQSSTHQARTMSMASTVVSPWGERSDSMVKANGIAKSDSQRTGFVASKRAPLVYPALLSKVADCFRNNITLGDQAKDGLDYKNSFTGEEAVSTISFIIKTTDRNLALLLGRSLDAQKFFHDVTYQHRLRDMKHEIYQFRETIVEDDSTEVNGVFTLLTECYSPTCTRDTLCYSIACPRRLEQQARQGAKSKPPMLKQDDDAAIHDDQLDDTTRKLWIHTVSKEIADTIDDKEKKRQEIISELMYTERDFVKDLEYLRDFWMKPLRQPMTSPIPEQRRERFVRTVFSNAPEVYQVNARLADQLTRRQQERPIVKNVGDIFLENVPRFKPFITYGSAQLYAKYEFEQEKRVNPAFVRFVDETERLKESRKLELNGYLTKPTTRLARYPLLLDGIWKNTADDNPDKEDIPKAIAMVRKFLGEVNDASGRAENRFNLLQLSKELKFRAGEFVDLKLTDDNRQLVFKSTLKKTPQEQQGDIHAYLFDHAVLLVRVKTVNKKEEHKVYRRPIPLELLVIAEMHEIIPKVGIVRRPSSGLMATRTQTMTAMSKDTAKAGGYPITFRHLGKGGYELTLYCASAIQQQKWMEAVDKQQNELRHRSNVYIKDNLSEGFFNAVTRVNCCVPIDGGRKLVVGTDNGIYVCERKPKDASIKPRRALDIKNVSQIDVLEQHSILLVLSDKTLYSYPLESLSPDAGQPGISKRGRKICHANFFKSGVCQGQQLVCCVKTSALSSTIRVYEPMDSMTKKSKKSGFAKMLAGNEDVLKPFKVSDHPSSVNIFGIHSFQVDKLSGWRFKEFYIPTESSSIHFLRSKLCVGCARGFEIVSLETLEAQSLLDQADTSLDFVQRKSDSSIKPVFIERIQTEFLLCYSDYSFFVNRNGWRARPDWIIAWEGNPNAFAIFNPYILAFEPSFIEIRHMDTGMLVHIITAKNVRMLHSSTREILYAYEDEMGEDVVASLDFWGNGIQPPTHRSMVEAIFSDTAWHTEPFLDEDTTRDPNVSGALKIHVPSVTESKTWPFYTYDNIDDPADWTVTWPLGSHSFTVDHDIAVVDTCDIDDQASVPELQAIPGLSFDREGTPESDADSVSLKTTESKSFLVLDPSKRERMDVVQDKSPRLSSVDWLGVSLLPGVSVMDRGRPVRKSSAACWPGVGRTYPSEALEEWRPRKES
ncbi:Rho1 guanine nucleotide exchange factor 1 [Venturia nashicola]|nr:Rho1 guanine nucleotide exchange factor 1 [Venturia nashicola]